MRAKLTKRTVDKLRKGEADAFLWDTELPGFGCKITPEGRRVFLLQYRMGGRGFPTRRYTIGTYGAFTADGARDFAQDLLAQIRKGIDPMADKASGRINNVSRLIAQFAKSRREKGRRTADEVQRLLEREIEPAWGTRPVVSITPADVAQVLDAISARGSPGTANQTLAYLKSMFNWALRRGAVKSSPASGIEKPAPDVRRERKHTDAELIQIWHAAEALGWPFGPAVHLMILMGQRREEIGQMKRPEIGREKKIWTIPGSRSKNGEPHDVHLSSLALSIIDAMPIAESDLIFTTTGDTPVSGWSKAKDQLDTAIIRRSAEDATFRRERTLQITSLTQCAGDETSARIIAKGHSPFSEKDVGRMVGIKHVSRWGFARVTDYLSSQEVDARVVHIFNSLEPSSEWLMGMESWRLHDLRRTFATGCNDLGVAPHVADRILNHVAKRKGGVMAVYNRAEYATERRAAMTLWAEHVERLLTSATANVVPMKRKETIGS